MICLDRDAELLLDSPVENLGAQLRPLRARPMSSIRRVRRAGRRASLSSIGTSHGCSPRPTGGSASGRRTAGCCCTRTRSTSRSGSCGARCSTAAAWSWLPTGRPGRRASLRELIVDERVTVLNATPSLFAAALDELLSAADALSLRLVVFGGEALQPSALRPWFDRFGDGAPRLVNMYGITETTVHVTYRPLTAADCDRDAEPDRGADPRPPDVRSRRQAQARSPRAFRVSCSSAEPASRAATSTGPS